MSEQKGRTPDYTLTALSKDTDRKGKVGAGWKNADGSISIVLNCFVTLEAQDGTILRLWPFDSEWKDKEGKTPKHPPARKKFDDMEDDIPF